MKKKVLALFLTAAMIMPVMTACGSESTEGTADSSETTDSETADSEDGGSDDSGSGEEVTLEMIFWDSNQQVGLEAMADGFMEKYPNITVTVETIPWDEYWTKLQAAAQGGDMPDVFVMHPDEVENYAQGGILMDMTEILDGETARSTMGTAGRRRETAASAIPDRVWSAA